MARLFLSDDSISLCLSLSGWVCHTRCWVRGPGGVLILVTRCSFTLLSTFHSRPLHTVTTPPSTHHIMHMDFRTNSILNSIASAKACIDTFHVERTVLMPSDLWLPRYSCFFPRKSVFPVCNIQSNIAFLFQQLQTPANVFILFEMSWTHPL